MSAAAATERHDRRQVADHRDQAQRQRQRLEVVRPADERAHRGVDQREQREPEQEEDRRSPAAAPGVRPTSGAPTAQSGPRTAAAIRSWNASSRSAGTAIATYCVSPAAPIPTTLPVSICRGEAALIISSMTRLLFSAATPVATHMP